ncbi:MAG: glutamyl-tRNA reductase [Chloroflexota bacterium]
MRGYHVLGASKIASRASWEHSVYLGMIGTDYHVADVELRERLALSGPALTEALREIAAAPGVAEVAILSTCNRTEVYFVPTGGAQAIPPAPGAAALGPTARGDVFAAACATITAYMSRVSGVPEATLETALVARQGRAALQHLCEVAGGLQSMVLAEAQIAAQVRHALQVALEEGTVGPELNAMFSAALRCGKRLRTETALGRADTSLAHVVVEVMRRMRPDLRAARILLVGAGKINAVAAEVLHGTNTGRLTVASRTLAAAQELAARVHAEARPLEDLRSLLGEADVVVTAMRLSQPLITADVLREARGPEAPPLLIADLAVPRNVSSDAHDLPGVTLLDVDSLQGTQDMRAVAAELERAATIVAEVVEETLVWARTREAVPVIAALRAHVDGSKEAELARTLGGLSHLAEEDREAVALLAHRLVNKMFHHLAVRMKKAAADPAMEGYLPVARYLFGVDDYPRDGADPHEEAEASSLVGSQG